MSKRKPYTGESKRKPYTRKLPLNWWLKQIFYKKYMIIEGTIVYADQFGTLGNAGHGGTAKHCVGGAQHKQRHQKVFFHVFLPPI